jgi:hypothetical protein
MVVSESGEGPLVMDQANQYPFPYSFSPSSSIEDDLHTNILGRRSSPGGRPRKSMG